MDIDQKKLRLGTVFKWLGGIVVVAVLSPVVFIALKGALGILALGATALVGITALKLTPIISMKTSNLLIKMIVREADANPIETMQNLLVEKTDELRQADAAIVEFETQVRNYDDQTKEFAATYPDEAADFKEISAKMHEGLSQQKEQQAEARKQLSILDKQIDKAQALYKMSLAASKVTEFSADAQKKVFQDIKEKVALNAVRTSLNRSFASLNMAISQRQQPVLIAPKSKVIDAEVVR